ncbi:uncharacterized protein LOC120824568 [Gasterosteus aculeatus]
MPQNVMNRDGGRGGTRHSTCRASGRGPGLVRGGAALNGVLAAPPQSTARFTQGNGAQPPRVVEGDVNHWYKSKKAAPPRTLKKRGGPASPVTHASAAGRVCSAGSLAGVSGKGAASLDAAASPVDCQQMAPRVILSKNQRRRNRKACPENHTLSGIPPPPPPEEEEEEDWEKESQEVTLIDWENNCFGINPYGPQDVIHFSLRYSPFQRRHEVVPLLMAGYSPEVHHPQPVRWRHYGTPTEQGQFADADH